MIAVLGRIPKKPFSINTGLDHIQSVGGWEDIFFVVVILFAVVVGSAVHAPDTLALEGCVQPIVNWGYLVLALHTNWRQAVKREAERTVREQRTTARRVAGHWVQQGWSADWNKRQRRAVRIIELMDRIQKGNVGVLMASENALEAVDSLKDSLGEMLWETEELSDLCQELVGEGAKWGEFAVRVQTGSGAWSSVWPSGKQDVGVQTEGYGDIGMKEEMEYQFGADGLLHRVP